MPNPRLPRVPASEMPDDIKAMKSASDALREEATFFEVMANNPDLLRWYIDGFYGDLFKSGRVPAPALEVLRLRLSAEHGCKFCNQGNRISAREVGLSDEEIETLFSDDISALRPDLMPVARLADELELTNPEGTLSADLHAALADHYSSAQIVELGLIGGILTGIAKFLFTFDLVEREEFCPFPHPDEKSI